MLEKRVGGLVLCGGRARRMGSDKAWLPFGAEYLLQRVVRVVKEIAGPVVVAARQDQVLPLLSPGVALVRDEYENVGPLAGLSAGLAALEGSCDTAIVVACDHPLITAGFLRSLVRSLRRDDSAIVPVDADRHYPLLAAYRVSVRRYVDANIEAGRYRVIEFLNDCGATRIDTADLCDDVTDQGVFMNINEPEGYEQALTVLGLR
jgi:molybdopterin-guanine dinucleotide biosynthesis protein A